MKFRERVLAAWNGSGYDHPPFTTWCFGFNAPEGSRWRRNGRTVERWFSLRMEHIRTLPQAWTLEDDFQRVLAWQALGIDDVLDVSVPWGMDPRVSWTDSVAEAGASDPCPVMVREYSTPSGSLRHAVRKTGEDPGKGWVVQPDHVPLFEDYNIPRAVEHLLSRPEQVPAAAHLYRGLDASQLDWLARRLEQVGAFARRHGVAVQAWSAFGMDAVVWFMGVEAAVFMAVDHPGAFGALFKGITEADHARTEAAARRPEVDMIVERGWYSSTDFWSPALLDRFLFPHIAQLAALAHRHGKKFAYVMTTGVEALGTRLVDAGVDVLYFIDPVQDTLTVARARELLGGRLTLLGGVNSTTSGGAPNGIRDQVRRAMEALADTGRFVLHPMDALHPDTAPEGLETAIQAWKECW